MMPRQITGRHVLLWMVLFFGVVIAVNLTMAFLATGTWTGLVVQNSYVASQQFNTVLEEAEKQKALDWRHDFSLDDGRIRFRLTKPNGDLVPLRSVLVLAGHPATEFHDRVIELTRTPDGAYDAPNDLPPGAWNLEIRAAALDGTDWKLRYRSTVRAKAVTE